MEGRTLYETSLPHQITDSNSWQFHYNRIMLGLEGTNQEKEAVIRKRILRYFGQFKIESESYFSIRNDVDYYIPGLQIMPYAIVMYGIDYMPIERAKTYFKGFATNIRRMDDSHYLVEFRNYEECLGAINKVKQKKYLLFSNPKDLIEKSNEGWIEMIPYNEFIFQRKLMARYLTSVDRINNICLSTKQSYSYAYSQAKRRFMKSLKEDVDEHQKAKSTRDRGHRNYYSQNQNSGSQSGDERISSRQKSRSRDKQFNNGSKWSSFERNCDCNSKRKYEQNTHCHCSQIIKCCHQNRSRSRSPSCSRQYGRKRGENSIEVKSAQSNFDSYIQKRNQKNMDVSYQKRAFDSLDLNTKHTKKDEKSASTSIEDCDFDKIEAQKKKTKLNESEVDFEQFLQRLKIEDSINDYSAFDFDEE